MVHAQALWPALIMTHDHKMSNKCTHSLSVLGTAGLFKAAAASLRGPVVFASMMVLLAANSSAQEAPRFILGEGVPRSILPPHMLEDEKLSEAEEATIERALRDLDSDNPEHRAGAVMLLGKYEYERARQAVLTGLGDSSARVRRAALVSVTEWNRQAPPEAALKVLAMVGDPDVEIRRLASSLVSSMYMVRRIAQMFQQREGGTEEAMLPETVKDSLLQAFTDEDALVRRNMITQIHTAGVQVPGDTLLTLMLDTDRNVRLEAIALAGSRVPPGAFLSQAEKLLDDEDRGVRLRLARQLASMPEGDALLTELTQDEDAEVSAEAMLGRLNWRPRDDVFMALMQRLWDGTLRREQAQRFLQWMRRGRELAQPHVIELLGLEDNTLRQEAARLFFNFRMADGYPGVLPELLHDRSADIRRLATGYLHAEPALINPALLEAMLQNRYPDVRKSLVSLCEHLPAAEGDEVLLDLLLDDNMEVRTTALQSIVTRQNEGWRIALRHSLRDPQVDMQRAALNLVMRLPQDDARALLEDFVRENPDGPLVPIIRRYLGNIKQETQNL